MVENILAIIDLHLIKKRQVDKHTWLTWKTAIGEVLQGAAVMPPPLLLLNLLPDVHIRLLLKGTTLEGLVLYEKNNCYRLHSVHNKSIFQSTWHKAKQIKDLQPTPYSVERVHI